MTKPAVGAIFSPPQNKSQPEESYKDQKAHQLHGREQHVPKTILARSTFNAE